MKEIWRDIPGYKGRYQASNKGRVRSLPHKVRVVACGTEALRTSPGKVLRPGVIDKFGHVSVALGKGNSVGVHCIIARTFIGPRPKNYDVAHLNGRGGDNRVSNLAYKTRAENNRDIFKHGRRKVNLRQIKLIRKTVGWNQLIIVAQKIGISVGYAYKIRRGTFYG
jgi:hypothetical protein